ncbi:MAG: NAD(P)(+) transhydrogenase (Re/Si-specific) subunit beta [Vicinamibacterales bacterium]|nr:NAD synthetase [Acidobacteriota bacterium]MDP6372677.1 NAD(P)(+) transhydrogenase (Re/Si-specific) subunit beta [Vicinamibacterales bacterium]MDP6610503.1 NAD(P)(+) transhydrogenase (Re/Si-specific) subunit beta [Vicinamibacterales bacterium]HAK54098.1 NAD synthetase [Acidobacteriota bacterium]
MNSALINLAYLAASVLFILGIKGLTHPRTAVRGNLYGASGMLLAIIATVASAEVFGSGVQGLGVILAGIVVGGGIGAAIALRIEMTAMPQMVALLNGFGGGASVFVAGAALFDAADPSTQMTVATVASGLIGGVTFFGSLVAFDKLQELVLPGKPIHFPGQQAVNSLIGLAALVVGYMIVDDPSATGLYWVLVALASVGGLLLTIPIGGADMPVAIALLNSYSGLAAASTGFVLNNNALIITGSLVGASGLILTRIMCKAMNRSLANVLTGAIGPEAVGGASADEVYAGKVKSSSPEEVAMLLDGARRVVIVPGYGLAVSQAQHAVCELADLLESKGTEVEFAIHPVAGRMPGHMNVLLAEADVAYDKLREMDDINPTFAQTDVAIVIGANDVVNPVANTDPTSPIAGMPILEVDKARTAVVIKRSLSPGFAGIPNPLFAADNTLMFFSDGKKAILDLITAIKEA